MRHALVDKRVAGIIRWLERLRESYSSGAMESALMEAECARADLENLRRDVWAKVKPVEVHGHRMNFAAPAFLALVIVLFAVAPLAKDIPAPVIEQDKNTLTLAQPIIIVREDAPKPEAQTPVTLKKPARRVTTPKRAASPSASSKPAPKITKTVPYDKVLSLVQTGQKALKNDKSVITIQ